MRNVHTWAAALALTLAATFFPGACTCSGDGGSDDAGPDGAEEVDGGTGQDAGGAGEDGGTAKDAGGGDAGVWTPPPTVAACAAPTLGTAVSIPGTPNRLLAPKLAWGGAEAGLAYVETATSGTWKVKLQRLSRSGALGGSSVDVGSIAMPAAGYPAVAIATNGAAYLVCYGPPTGTSWPGFDCARVPVGSGGATAAASITTAGYPALGFGPGGFMLAYRNSAGFQAQPLGADGTPNGTPQLIRLSAAAGAGQLVALAPIPTGYAVATAIASEAPLLYRLSPTGQVSGSGITVGRRGLVAIASAGDLVGASWIAANGEATAAILKTDNTVTSSATLSTNARSYGQVAMAGAGGKFGVTWSAFAGFIGYRALAADGTAEGAQVTAHGAGWDDNPHDLVAVSDGFLLATTMNPGMDSLAIVHLGCP